MDVVLISYSKESDTTQMENYICEHYKVVLCTFENFKKFVMIEEVCETTWCKDYHDENRGGERVNNSNCRNSSFDHPKNVRA